MDITFITMHEMEEDAKILFASDSVVEVLGYSPDEFKGHSFFDYFHKDEVKEAREFQRKEAAINGASSLKHYKLKHINGNWVACECVFTIVEPIVVTCISLYLREDGQPTEGSKKRALTAPVVRHAFTPEHPYQDPRYHMMEHMSSKFEPQGLGTDSSPRAAMILNRFTRTLTILYSTHTIFDVLGITQEQAVGRSFFECMSEDCLQDAVDVIERAKENDSIAYLRFQWINPRNRQEERGRTNSREGSVVESVDEEDPQHDDNNNEASHNVDDASTDPDEVSPDRTSSTSSRPTLPSSVSSDDPEEPFQEASGPIVVEAVISCSSDGLVVVLRRAYIPEQTEPVFMGAAPWAAVPRLPEGYIPKSEQPNPPVAPERKAVSSGPTDSYFMEHIRKYAAFAWSLRSISPKIMRYAKSDTKPDNLAAVGGATRPDGTYAKRQREWEESIELAEQAREHPDDDDPHSYSRLGYKYQGPLERPGKRRRK